MTTTGPSITVDSASTVHTAPTQTAPTAEADVIVVGAGPGGSATAYWLAQSGLDVLLVEKASFPRDKVCGDGFTPRGVKPLIDMGIDTGPGAGWIRHRGLRVYGGGHRLEMDWPELASYPNYGLVRPRLDFDEMLARHAQKAGAQLVEGTRVDGPILDRAGRVVGVEGRAEGGSPVTYRAPLVIDAGGMSGTVSKSLGLTRRSDRPMGVAVRRYFTSPRTNDEYIESWLELRDGERLLPGYGWIFGMGDGTVNVGLGVLNSSTAYGNTDYREMLKRWLDNVPAEWTLTEQSATGPVRGAGLPMGFNRTPQYTRGLMLVGDAAGAINPFNGEGIAYAMETGKLAAEHAVQALARPAGPHREQALRSYVDSLKGAYGGYYRLGNIFVKLIGHPEVMRLCTTKGLPRPLLMKFVLKLLANLTDERGGDTVDRVINGLTRLAPAA